MVFPNKAGCIKRAAVRLLYFINRYPALSHTFIRREIIALEALGAHVSRVALRTDAADRLPDPADRAELCRTALLLSRGKARLAGRLLKAAGRRPLAAVRVLAFALGLARRSAIRPGKMLAYWAEALLLVDAAHAADADLVRVHFGTNCAVVARLARRLGGPSYSIAYHGPDEFDAPERWDLAGTIAEAAAVTAISAYCAAQLMRWADPIHWPKIQVVGCLVDGEAFRAQAMPDGPRRLCLVARLAPQKGIPLLLDALAALPDPPELSIVGDGPARAALEAHARHIGLADKVRFLGALSGSAVRDVIARSHAFILPSFAEGLPVVIMEAMAVGRPVIATSIAGVGELVVGGVTGWLAPAGSREALGEAIAEFLRADTETLAAMGRAGAERVRARHSAASEAPRLLDYCAKAIEESGRGQSAYHRGGGEAECAGLRGLSDASSQAISSG